MEPLKQFAKFVHNVAPKLSNSSNKQLLAPKNLTKPELLSILKRAKDLKSEKEKPPSLKGKSAILLLQNPNFNTEISVTRASKLLDLNLISVTDNQVTEIDYIQDIGELLSLASDLVLCNVRSHRHTEYIFAKCKVPAINVQNRRYRLLHVLSDLLTLHEHFGTFKNLKMAWVGPTGSLINTYLHLATMVGINIKYKCFSRSTGECMSPACLPYAKEQCKLSSSQVAECMDMDEALEGTHVIATQRHALHKYRISNKYMATADKNCILLHLMPRSVYEVDEDVFASKRNLTWKSFYNQQWVCAACILKCLEAK